MCVHIADAHSHLSIPMRLSSLAVAALLVLAPAARGQGTAARPAAARTRTGRIAGTVSDSVRMKPLAGGALTILKVSPEPLEYFSVTTDAAGRYHVDTLAAGQYEVSFSSPLLDSLQVALPPQRVTLAEGGSATVDFATPSGRTLRAASCPGINVQPGSGAVVGRVTSVETSQPIPGAVVAVSWPDLTLDPATKRPKNEMKSGGVRADSTGLYRLCGVPTAVHLLIQVQRDDRVGSVIELAVPDDAGVAMLDLAYSEKDSRPADEGEVTAADTAKAAPLTGAATVTGVVRGIGGEPIGDVQVQVVDAGTPVRTAGDGRFTIPALPAGSQLLEARKVGYRIGRYPVQMTAGRTATQDIVLTKIITLDSVKIVAQRTLFREFEERRRLNSFGSFLRQEQIERRNPTEVSDLMRAYGFTVTGQGIDTKLYYGRGRKSIILGPCPVNVVIDRVPNQDINLVDPREIAGIEVYKGSAGAPSGYEAACGLVLIWTKH